MNKTLLVQQIIATLNENLTVLQRAARASHVEATHESSKAENKYDTRGLEAAYLAGGQARQAKEILDSIKLYQSLALRDLGRDDPIDLTAVVKLDADRFQAMYFIGSKSGGLEVEYDGQEIVILTPQSPLGQNLLEKKAGHRWAAELGGSIVKYHIVEVW